MKIYYLEAVDPEERNLRLHKVKKSIKTYVGKGRDAFAKGDIRKALIHNHQAYQADSLFKSHKEPTWGKRKINKSLVKDHKFAKKTLRNAP